MFFLHKSYIKHKSALDIWILSLKNKKEMEMGDAKQITFEERQSVTVTTENKL